VSGTVRSPEFVGAPPGENPGPDTDTRPARRRIPLPVRLSFWIWMLSAAALTVSAGLLLVQRGDIITQTQRHNPAATPEQVVAAVNRSLAWTIGLYLVCAVVYVVLALRMRAGRNWARVALAVIMVLGLMQQMSAGTSSIGTLMAIAAVLLMYLPSVGDYFQRRGRHG